MNPILFVAGGIADLAALIFLLLTHFGVVQGGLVIAPILFAFGITLWLLGVGLPPVGSPFVMVFFAILLEAAIYFNWLGLQGVL